MPARVHALVVVRPDGRTPAAFHLRRTLAAVGTQTRPVDALTIVVCGDDPGVAEVAASASATIVRAPASTSYAAAAARVEVDPAADAVWLLAQDTAPEPEALGHLAGALEVAPSVAFSAPKLVRWDDRTVIVSLGVSANRYGRTVGLADGEFDQGQHDGRDDVLGADVRGLLVRADAWHSLGGLDPALSGADEGLDLGVRARLAGARVVLAPAALVAVSGDGVAGLPAPLHAGRRRRIAYASRVARLHRRLVYAPAWAVPLMWLTILPAAAGRTVLHLLRKRPSLIMPEWGAAVVVAVRVLAVIRARRRISSSRRAGWAQLAPLRVTRAEEREHLDDETDDDAGGRHHRGELRFFAGGGAWLVLAALLASIAAFTALLAWPVLGGGALAPLRAGVGQLWADASFGRRALGLDTVGPADPFAAVVAVLGTLTPWDPSRIIVVVWVLALPLAALGGWFAATRVTDRSLLRITGGAVWALAPTFLVSLVDGRVTGVLVHLLLPWLLYAGSVAHRSWSGAGAASLLLAAVLACSPSLTPAMIVLWFAAIVIAIVVRAGRGVSRLVWTLVPTLVMAAPLLWHHLFRGTPWALLADPGVPWPGPQVGPDSAGRALLTSGIPTPDIGGWATLLPAGPVWWVPLLAAPLALLAVVAPVTQRWAAGIVLLIVTATGLATATAAVGVSVAAAGSESIALWPGAGLSLAWLGAMGGALVALDAGLAPRLEPLRTVAAVVLCAAMVVLAVPSLTAMTRGTAMLTNGPASTLPAYVAAEGRDDPDLGTVVLTPQNAGGVAAEVVWGGSETIGAQSTVVSTRPEPTADDVAVAELAADLLTPAADDVVADLARTGIGFVLLAPAATPESDAARTLRITAANALDQREQLDSVGDTDKGTLWRVDDDLSPRPAVPGWVHDVAGLIATLQVAVVAIALLLAVPTAATRRVARRTPRIVGPHWREVR
ncbi:glycosyltransferase [Microbacterium sp. Marseille-Q6648]|uniref:glycosyltransferase n=1 Tax=Microbacterium sp. Marseille-Q6648 TaxID=2937991 RepID=UPI002041734D|nr:glycosyltransferase [Microbacterium sp. Marseille-Q6648]